MVDMALCENDECPSRHHCYRYMVEPNPWRQSYALFEPDASGKCEAFILVEGEEGEQ